MAIKLPSFVHWHHSCQLKIGLQAPLSRWSKLGSSCCKLTQERRLAKNPRLDAETIEERRSQKHEGRNRLPHAPKGSLFAFNIGPKRHSLDMLREVSNRFPFQDSFGLKGAGTMCSREIMNVVKEAITPERWKKMIQVVAGRTFSVVPILEGINDRGNIGAVARTAEALGFGALHYIRTIDPSKIKSGSGKRTSMGAQKWMDMQAWDNTEACMQHLKGSGYLIAATHLDPNSIPITDLDWSKPTAVVMGNEAFGVSHEVLKYADQTVIIPQAPGFVDSLNVSVAASLILYEAYTWRVRHLGRHGDLDETQQSILMAAMLLRHKDINAILRREKNLSLEELDDLDTIAREGEESWEKAAEKKRRHRMMPSL